MRCLLHCCIRSVFPFTCRSLQSRPLSWLFVESSRSVISNVLQYNIIETWHRHYRQIKAHHHISGNQILPYSLPTTTSLYNHHTNSCGVNRDEKGCLRCLRNILDNRNRAG